MSASVDARFGRYASGFSNRDVRLLRVGKSLTSPFRQISDAIRASRPYDRIEVESGRYFEALLINHPLELCSAGDGEPPVISSRGPSLSIQTDGPVLLDGLTISTSGTKTSDSQSVVIECGSPVIQSCDLSSVYVLNNATPQISHCRIRNSDYGCGLSISGSSAGVYSNNDISGHNEECVRINSSGRPDLHHNRISQKNGCSSTAVLISGRSLNLCEPLFHDNIVRGNTVAEDYLDPTGMHSPKMLTEERPNRLPCLLRVSAGATPLLVGNLLSNGVVGFCFTQCKMPPDRFSCNRVLNCSAWGIAICDDVHLAIQSNDVRSCGGGIRVSASPESSNGPRISLSKCDMQNNHHYGILIDHSAVIINECNVVQSSIGLAFLGNCAACKVTHNTLTHNSVAAFSLMRAGRVVLEHSIVDGCGNGMYGAFLLDGSHLTLNGCKITGTATSVFLRDGSHLVAEQNELSNASVHHVVLVEKSQATLRENTIQCSGYASAVITDGSEATFCSNVMYSSAREGILVEEKGKVKMEGNGLSSMHKAICVRSGGMVYAEENDVALSAVGIFISGQESSCESVSNRFRSVREVALQVVDYAHLTARLNTVSEECGMGLRLSSGANAVLEDSVIRSCKDGAIYMDGIETNGRILRCSLEVLGYGIHCAGQSRAHIEGNQLRGCTRFGVMCDSKNETMVHNNTITTSGVGFLLSARGKIHNNSINECSVGILARPRTRAEVWEERLDMCIVGLSIEAGAALSIRAIAIQNSRKSGIVIDGASPTVTISDAIIEHSKGCGVSVLPGGACRFLRCVFHGGRECGVRLERAGAVVFEDCALLDQRRGIDVYGLSNAEGTAANSTTTTTNNNKNITAPAASTTSNITTTTTTTATTTTVSAPIATVANSIETSTAVTLPLFLRCVVDGANGENGVVGSSFGTAELRLCRISAKHPSEGVGVLMTSASTLRLIRCDVVGCPRAGLDIAPSSRAVVEKTNIEGCGIGILLSPAKANDVQTVTKETEGTDIKQEDEQCGGAALSRLAVKDCSSSGVWCASGGRGTIDSAVIDACANGVVIESDGGVVLCNSIIRHTRSSGLRLRGRLADCGKLSGLTISSSGEYGIWALPNSDAWIHESEITQNTNGGALLEANVTLEDCAITNNAETGIICRGKCQPILRGCRLQHSAVSNLCTLDGASPELYNCVLEDSPSGARVCSALQMHHCIARRTEVAVDIAEGSEGTSTFTDCAFKENQIALTVKAITHMLQMDRCEFESNGQICVNLYQLAAAKLCYCRFTSSPECLLLNTEGGVVVDNCDFAGSLKAITAFGSANLEVHKCNFAQQIHHAICITASSGTNNVRPKVKIVECDDQNFLDNVEEMDNRARRSIVFVGSGSDGGAVRICDNRFSGSAQNSIIIATHAAVKVCGNTFERDVCGVKIQIGPMAYLYNNAFRDCQMGLLISGVYSNATVLSNVFEKNTCGCRCEESSRARLWRNAFVANSAHAILITTLANPIIVENTFRQHTTTALCIQNGGAGQLAFNAFSKNTCGVQLNDTGDEVFFHKTTFEGNGTSVKLGPGAMAHIVACEFSSGTVCDVFAIGALGTGGCVLAYCAFSPLSGSLGVQLQNEANVLMYRCVFHGAGSTGLQLGSDARCTAAECLFYSLGRGIVGVAPGENRVSDCVFLHCSITVEARNGCNATFYACHVLSSSGNTSGAAVDVFADGQPSIQQCSFFGETKVSSLLLRSSGGGCIEGNTFVAAPGCTSVLLKTHCTSVLRRNTFLTGGVGIIFDPRSEPVVEGNTFHRHDVAAVKLMDNAGGRICQNMFFQPLEKGGLLAGTHNVIIDGNTIREVARAKDLAGVANHETPFLDIFGDFLETAPCWVLQSLGEMPSLAGLPSSLLARMNDTILLLSASPEVAETPMNLNENEARDLPKNEARRSTAPSKSQPHRETEAEMQPQKKKTRQDSQFLQRVGTSKGAKKSRKNKLPETVTYEANEVAVMQARDVLDELLQWANAHSVELQVPGPTSLEPRQPMRSRLNSDGGLDAVDASAGVAAVAAAAAARKVEECRGDATEKASEALGAAWSTCTLANSRDSTVETEGGGKSTKPPLQLASLAIKDSSIRKASTKAPLKSRSQEKQEDGREGVYDDDTEEQSLQHEQQQSKRKHEKQEGKRISGRKQKKEHQHGQKQEGKQQKRRRRIIPPPLRSTDIRAQPKCPPRFGLLPTFVACVHKCQEECGRRKPKPKCIYTIEDFSPIPIDSDTELPIVSTEEVLAASSYAETDIETLVTEIGGRSTCSRSGYRSTSVSTVRVRSRVMTESTTDDHASISNGSRQRQKSRTHLLDRSTLSERGTQSRSEGEQVSGLVSPEKSGSVSSMESAARQRKDNDISATAEAGVAVDPMRGDGWELPHPLSARSTTITSSKETMRTLGASISAKVTSEQQQQQRSSTGWQSEGSLASRKLRSQPTKGKEQDQASSVLSTLNSAVLSLIGGENVSENRGLKITTHMMGNKGQVEGIGHTSPERSRSNEEILNSLHVALQTLPSDDDLVKKKSGGKRKRKLKGVHTASTTSIRGRKCAGKGANRSSVPPSKSQSATERRKEYGKKGTGNRDESELGSSKGAQQHTSQSESVLHTNSTLASQVDATTSASPQGTNSTRQDHRISAGKIAKGKEGTEKGIFRDRDGKFSKYLIHDPTCPPISLDDENVTHQIQCDGDGDGFSSQICLSSVSTRQSLQNAIESGRSNRSGVATSSSSLPSPFHPTCLGKEPTGSASLGESSDGKSGTETQGGVTSAEMQPQAVAARGSISHGEVHETHSPLNRPSTVPPPPATQLDKSDESSLVHASTPGDSATSVLPRLTVSSLRESKTSRPHSCDKRPKRPRVSSSSGRHLLALIEGALRRDELRPLTSSSYHSPHSPLSELSRPLSVLSHSALTTSPSSVEGEVTEDVIAILRWLADLRERRMLSPSGFGEAVEQLQTASRVPFFLRDDDNGHMSVVVRLPQTLNETVTVPLLGDDGTVRVTAIHNTKREVEIERENEMRSSAEQLHNLETSQETKESLPLFVKLPLLCSKETEPPTLDHPGPLTEPRGHRVERALTILAHCRLPRGHYRSRLELPYVLDAARRAREGADVGPVVFLGSVMGESGEEKDRREASDGNLSNAKRLNFPNSWNTVSQKAVKFNPAVPQETSPYNKSTRIAAFIATGTANFMM